MNTAFSFLQRLGVDETTDERSIRRAYARELKQLDHEHDIEGFQQLREAYDTALDWVRRQVAAPQPPSEPLPLPQPQASGPRYGPLPVAVHQRLVPAAAPGPVPALLVVLAGFDAGFERLCANGTPQIDAVAGLLRESLASEALEGLAARERFEEHMAHRLAQGWRPGHETLFPAACTVFGWSDDSRRLQRFGDKGDYLNQAIEQRLAFDSQDADDVRSQGLLLDRLRAPELPEKTDMRRVFDHFDTLVSYMPAWLCVVAPRDNLLRWRAYYDTMGTEPNNSFAIPDTPVEPRRKSGTGGSLKWAWLWAVFVLVKACHALVSPSTSAPADSVVSAEMMELVRLQATPATGAGTEADASSIRDDNGNVIVNVEGQASNALPAGAATGQAIREAQPFSASVRPPAYRLVEPPAPGPGKRPDE